jgi:hypothetical protein
MLTLNTTFTAELNSYKYSWPDQLQYLYSPGADMDNYMFRCPEQLKVTARPVHVICECNCSDQLCT